MTDANLSLLAPSDELIVTHHRVSAEARGQNLEVSDKPGLSFIGQREGSTFLYAEISIREMLRTENPRSYPNEGTANHIARARMSDELSSRPDQGHLSSSNVHNLRQIVKSSAYQKAPHARQTRVKATGCRGGKRAGVKLGIRIHMNRPKPPLSESGTIRTDAIQAQKYWARAIELDHKRDEQHQGNYYRQGQQDQKPIDHGLDRTYVKCRAHSKVALHKKCGRDRTYFGAPPELGNLNCAYLSNDNSFGVIKMLGPEGYVGSSTYLPMGSAMALEIPVIWILRRIAA